MSAVIACWCFVASGLAMEMIFDGLHGVLFVRCRERRLAFGRTTLWMVPVYLLAAPVFVEAQVVLAGVPQVGRLTLYAIGIWTVEGVYGSVLRLLLGEAPWERSYREHIDSIGGLVRLSYFPFWCAAAFVFERLAAFVSR